MASNTDIEKEILPLPSSVEEKVSDFEFRFSLSASDIYSIFDEWARAAAWQEGYTLSEADKTMSKERAEYFMFLAENHKPND